jgi:hypothetical protein
MKTKTKGKIKRVVQEEIVISLNDADTLLYRSLRMYDLPTYTKLTGEGKHPENEYWWLRLLQRCIMNEGYTTRVKYLEGIIDDLTKANAVEMLKILDDAGLCVITGDKITCPYAKLICHKKNLRAESAKKAALSRWAKSTQKQVKVKTQKQKQVVKAKVKVPEPVKELQAVKIQEPEKQKKQIGFDYIAWSQEQFKDLVLQKTFIDFLEMRKAKRTPNIVSALERLAKRLRVLSNDDAQIAVTILDKSIRSGWTDLYPTNEKAMSLSNQTYKDVYEQLKAKYYGN